MLRNWLAGRGVVDLQATHLRSVDRLVTEWHGQRRVEVPGAAVRRIGGRLVALGPTASACGRLTRVEDTELGGDLARVLFTEKQIDRTHGRTGR